MNLDTHYICTVCNKRWGTDKEGADMVVTKCEKHRDKLSTREQTARGLTAGTYMRREQAREKRGW